MSNFSKQLVLDLPFGVNFQKESFIIAPCNQRAFGIVDLWPRWSSRFQALCGNEKSGKTHLGTIWRYKSGAHILPLPTLASESVKPFWVLDLSTQEDIDNLDQEKLFHLYNRVHNERGWMLVLSPFPPASWPSSFVDLASRLRSIPMTKIGDPDDVLLEKTLRKLFSDRQLEPAPNLFPYLLRRAERSLLSMYRLVDALDKTALQAHRPITIALARGLLETSF